MTMKEAVTSVFNNYANFDGRARRSEYWYFMTFYVLIKFAFTLLLLIIDQGSALDRIVVGLNALFSLSMFIPRLAVIWRRLHDIGKSGANWCWAFVPLVGAIVLLVWFCREGDEGENRYGPDPREEYRYDND